MSKPGNVIGRSSQEKLLPARQATGISDRRCPTNVLNNKIFKYVMAVSLIVALFGGPLFTLLDIPDTGAGLAILDLVMVLATVMFLVELTLNYMASYWYRWSFFFAMDILGTASMALEISFLMGGVDTVHAVVLRSARAAKLGARAGRIFKLVMCCFRAPEGSDKGFQAKVLAQRITTSIATRVAMLTIFLIAILPLLDLPVYPRADQSMVLWARNLEEAFATNQTRFAAETSSLIAFYENNDYAPFALEGFSFLLDSPVSAPARIRNQLLVEVPVCLTDRPACKEGIKAGILFNFTGASQISAIMEVVLVVVIVLVMILMTFDLGRVLNVMMVRPLEKMFSGLLKNAQSLMDLCSSAESSDSDEDDETRSTELELIERALDKLARIAKQALNKNVISKEEMANKSEYEKAVLVEILGAEVSDPQGTHLTAPDWAQSGPQRDMESKLQTWEFNTLDQDEAGLERMAMHIFFDSEFGVASEFCEDAIFKSFFDAVKPQYKEVPYHCFAHACDVLHTVFRFCGLTNGRLWMRKVDQYALLISALCHDMGHEGRTNPFLVESKDTLAITYNDKSPLENMHCARLFTLCTDEKTNAFGKASPELYKEARKVAVAAILHTDNANHFEMIKDISQVYEAHEKCCEDQAGTKAGMRSDYRDKILEANRLLWLELFLHLADVSNPLKPFDTCRAWAWRVLDEFFQQGDAEKAAGLPVGMLNDRDKVNRPGSQHGFIVFLVSPLVRQSVNLFPQMTELHMQMTYNLGQWRDAWVKDAQPSAEDQAKKDEDISRSNEVTQKLLARRNPPEPALSRKTRTFNNRDTE